jgi:hypothetical protein
MANFVQGTWNKLSGSEMAGVVDNAVVRSNFRSFRGGGEADAMKGRLGRRRRGRGGAEVLLFAASFASYVDDAKVELKADGGGMLRRRCEAVLSL